MATSDEAGKCPDDLTAQELNFIFGTCSGLGIEEIAQQHGITTDVVRHAMGSVFDKAGVSNRLELVVFVINTLNAELRRRSGLGE